MEFHFEIVLSECLKIKFQSEISLLECREMEFQSEIVFSECQEMEFHFEIISLQCIKSVFRLRREKMSDESGSRVCSGAFPVSQEPEHVLAVVFDFFKHNLESDSGSYRKFLD